MKEVDDKIKLILAKAARAILIEDTLNFDWKPFVAGIFVYQKKYLIDICLFLANLPSLELKKEHSKLLENIYILFQEKNSERLKSQSKKLAQLVKKKSMCFEETKFEIALEMYEYGLSYGRISELIDINVWDMQKRTNKYINCKKINQIKECIIDESALRTICLTGVTSSLEKLRFNKNKEINHFFITESTSKKVVFENLNNKNGFDSIKLIPQLGNGTIEIKEVNSKTKLINSSLINESLFYKNIPIPIISNEEEEIITLVINSKEKILVSDDFNIIELIIKPSNFRKRIEKKLKLNLKLKKLHIKNKVVNSSELIIESIKKGSFEQLTYANYKKIKNFNKIIARSVLEKFRENGCPIEKKKIKEMISVIKN